MDAHAEQRDVIGLVQFNSCAARGLALSDRTTASGMGTTGAQHRIVDPAEDSGTLSTKELESQTKSLQVRVDWTRETMCDSRRSRVEQA
jgi:hypothetical protein